jgi:hypothetical protein
MILKFKIALIGFIVGMLFGLNMLIFSISNLNYIPLIKHRTIPAKYYDEVEYRCKDRLLICKGVFKEKLDTK